MSIVSFHLKQELHGTELSPFAHDVPGAAPHAHSKETDTCPLPPIDSGIPDLSWRTLSFSLQIGEEQAALAYVSASNDPDSFPEPLRFVNDPDIRFPEGMISGRFLSLSFRFLGRNPEAIQVSKIRLSADTGDLLCETYTKEDDIKQDFPVFPDLSPIGIPEALCKQLSAAFGMAQLRELEEAVPYLLAQGQTPGAVREAAEILSGSDVFLCEHNLFPDRPALPKRFNRHTAVSLFLRRDLDPKEQALFHQAMQSICPDPVKIYVYTISPDSPCPRMDESAFLDENAKILLPNGFCLDTRSKMDSTGVLMP